MRTRMIVAVFAFVTLLRAAAAPVMAEEPHHGAHDATSQRSFADVEKWRKVFDDPARDAWQKPAALVDALQLQPGMTVAEIGAGTGYLLRYLAAAVGAEGTVLLADVEPSLIAHLRARAEEEGAANVVPVLASKDNPRLPARAADVILFLDTYHHIDDRVNYMRDLRRCLRPGGRVVVVDWLKKKLPEGPPPDHKLERHQVVDEMEQAGFAFVDAPLELPYHYFLVFGPQD